MILRHSRMPVVGEIPSSAMDAKPCFHLINVHCIASNRKERIAVRMVDRTAWAMPSKARVEAKLTFKPAMVVLVEWLVRAVPVDSTKTAIANSSRQSGNQSCLKRLQLRSVLILLARAWDGWER
jgi:BarA-like signal transduction histidine kinase